MNGEQSIMNGQHSITNGEQSIAGHRSNGSSPSIAIVHDYLTQRGGAERVVLSLCKAFPEAPVYTSFYEPEGTFDEFRNFDIRPLWLDRAAPLRKRHRIALPILPFAFATSRVEADVVVCSSSGFAHGIRTQGRKLVYCHSPAKWLYRRDDYLGTHPSRVASLGLRMLDPLLRRLDRRAAASADKYVTNSTFVASQVQDAYGIETEVVPPPAGLVTEGPVEPVPGVKPGFFLIVARLMPYKNLRQVTDAFRHLPELSLVVVGEGPERDELVASAPSNVRFLGAASDSALRWLYANTTGLVAASKEDFGLTAVEAACFGKPVTALRWGGLLDTVRPNTGVFFDAPDALLIALAIKQLLDRSWNPNAIRAHAATFAEGRFIDRIQHLAYDLHDQSSNGRGTNQELYDADAEAEDDVLLSDALFGHARADYDRENDRSESLPRAHALWRHTSWSQSSWRTDR
jgi:glycosyltransferase involved in cell wall biosynthesis